MEYITNSFLELILYTIGILLIGMNVGVAMVKDRPPIAYIFSLILVVIGFYIMVGR